MDVVGQDADGKKLKASQLWQETAGSDGSHASWYRGAIEYWDKQEASYNGVLGGFGFVSDVDIRDSAALIKKAFKDLFEHVPAAKRRAIDCGAGVGRVTELLLLNHFGTVDLLEPSKHLLEAARVRLSTAVAPPGHTPGSFLCEGLQEFCPPAGLYHCIWVQWCLLYLTDEDAVELLRRCGAALAPHGRVVVKENACKDGFVVDRDDNSVTRSSAHFLSLAAQAGMGVLYNVKQKGMPEGLFGVRMYVLRPKQVPQ